MIRVEKRYRGFSESRPDSPHHGQISLCRDTLVVYTTSFHHAVAEVAQYIKTTVVNGNIDRVECSSQQEPPGPCGRAQGMEEFMASNPPALNATCGAGMHDLIEARFRTASGPIYHFGWSEASQRDIVFWVGADPDHVQHIPVRGDWAQIICRDIDADGLEDLIVLSTTDGYLAPDQHIQVFKVRNISE